MPNLADYWWCPVLAVAVVAVAWYFARAAAIGDDVWTVAMKEKRDAKP